MEAIFGAVRKSSGKVLLDGWELTIDNPTMALRDGIGFVTENRRENGFFKNLSIAQNIMISRLNRDAKGGTIRTIINEKQNTALAQKYGKPLNVVCASYTQSIMDLSGGNQQKVIIAKWLASEAKVLIMDEPTKGIDVGAKSETITSCRSLRTLASELSWYHRRCVSCFQRATASWL